jgi:hypothetical protein
MIEDEFSRSVKGDVRRTEGRPSPQAQFEKGIQSRDVIDWLFSREPETPEPAPEPDNPALWGDAVRDADAEHKSRAAVIRERFRAKGQKVRDDLHLARDYREREP